IINLYKAYKTHSKFYIFTEYCNGGDLELLKDIKGRINEKMARIILTQLVEGIRELHDRNIMHRDLKLANILLHFPDRDLMHMSTGAKRKFLEDVDLTKEKFELKIADFGF